MSEAGTTTQATAPKRRRAGPRARRLAPPRPRVAAAPASRPLRSGSTGSRSTPTSSSTRRASSSRTRRSARGRDARRRRALRQRRRRVRDPGAAPGRLQVARPAPRRQACARPRTRSSPARSRSRGSSRCGPRRSGSRTRRSWPCSRATASAVSAEGGVVTLDLERIVLEAADRIGIRDQVEDKLPEDVGRIEILRSDELDTAQDAFQLLNTLAWVLPILAFLLFAAAAWLAPDRRRLVRRVGIALALVGVLGLLLVNLVGNYLVNELVADTESRTAASNAWDILTRPAPRLVPRARRRGDPLPGRRVARRAGPAGGGVARVPRPRRAGARVAVRRPRARRASSCCSPDLSGTPPASSRSPS